jgi:hypothetical protein
MIAQMILMILANHLDFLASLISNTDPRTNAILAMREMMR